MLTRDHIEINLRFIRDEFDYLGISNFPASEIADKIRLNPGKFHISDTLMLSQYGSRTDMDYDIHFKKHERPNMYLPYQYQATLRDAPFKTHRFRVNGDATFTLQDVFNLLNGRAVRKLELNWLDRKMQNSWFQLDFKARGVHGNFKLERLPVSDRDYVVSALLDRYAIREMKVPEERTRIILSLIRGNAEEVTLLNGGRQTQAFIEASPKTGSVAVYKAADKAHVQSIMKQNNRSERLLSGQDESLQRKKRKGKSL